MTNDTNALVTRAQIIERAKQQLAEIEQYFLDVEHWNSTRTRFEQVPADPDGEITELRESLKRMVAA